MFKKIMNYLLSAFLMFCALFPSNIITTQAADNDYIIVDDTEVDTTQNHFFTYLGGVDQQDGANGWSSLGAAKVPDSEGNAAKTQHWIWNANHNIAKKYTYTFTFIGTGVELVGKKNDAVNVFQMDNDLAETVAITGPGNASTTLYSKQNLSFKKHTVTVTLPSPGTGLQVSYAKVFGVTADTTIKETITPDMQESAYNAFHYKAYEGVSWVSSSAEAYINLGTNNKQAEECYYEIPFVGNKIAITATKAPAHGIVKFSVDGQGEQIVDLYATTRSPAIVYTMAGLNEGPHVLKAVTQTTKSGSQIVNQVVKAEVYHEAYVLSDIIVDPSFSLMQGASQEIIVLASPAYAPIDNLTFSSKDENIATVSKNGMITALNEGNTTIQVSANGVISKQIAITVVPQVKGIGGSIVDENLQYTQDTYDKVKTMGMIEKKLSAWQNDKAISEIAIIAKDSSLQNVNLEISDLKNDFHSISANNVTATFVKSVDAVRGMPGWQHGPQFYPVGNRAESSDVLYTTDPVNLKFNQIQPIWIDIAIPKDIPAGTYTGTIKVRADEIKEEDALTFTYHVNVQNAKLPDASEFKDGFDIELWQYPYSSAEYYDVTPFSKEHFDILTSMMKKYESIGGHAITTTISEDAWTGQTYSKNEVRYPSMVKWIENSDGSFTYDYKDFDKWIQFNKDLGMGDKIVIYSIAPWTNSFTFWRNGKLVKESYDTNSDRYRKVWTHFLENLVKHLDEKEWFDDAYIGIDERGLSMKVLNLVDSVSNKDGKKFKTAGAMDGITSSEEHRKIARRITDLNVGDTVVQQHPDDFANLLADRNAKGLRTTLYSCTGHIPGNFSLSAPAENYWSILFAYKNGTVGFLRWAYDAWVEDPLRDTTHWSYEAGDCFTIFPDEKNAANPTAKSSIRLEKMAQGVRDANKLMKMVKEYPTLQKDVDTLMGTLQTKYASSGYFLTDEGKKVIAADMTAFRLGLDDITDKYLELKGMSVNRSEIQHAIVGAKAYLTQGNEYTKETFDAFKISYDKAVQVELDVASLQTNLDHACKTLITAQANLLHIYTVDVKANDDKAGTVNGAGIYAENSKVEVTAVAKSGYHFVNWTIDNKIVSKEIKYTFEVKKNIRLFANFAKDKSPVVPVEKDTIGNEDGSFFIDGKFLSGTKLIIKKMSKDDMQKIKNKIIDQSFVSKVTFEKVFDMTFVDKDNIKVNLDGSIKVRIKLDTNSFGKKLEVYFISDDGSLEAMKSTIVGDELSFTTTHGYKYAIVSYVGTEAPTPDNNIAPVKPDVPNKPEAPKEPVTPVLINGVTRSTRPTGPTNTTITLPVIESKTVSPKSNNKTETVKEKATPKAKAVDNGNWSLATIISVLITALLAFSLLFAKFRKEKISK